MIVNKGRELLARYFAGISPVWAGAIELGVGETPVSQTDESLDFPYVRVDVEYLDYDAVTHRVIARATVPSDVSGEFHEIGIFSSEDFPEGAQGHQLLLDYNEDTTYVVDNAVLTTSNIRVGNQGYLVSVPSGSTGYVRGYLLGIDLNEYVGNDILSLAYHYNETGIGAPNVTVRFESTDSDYFSHTFNPTVGYNIESISRSGFAQTGTPDWSTVNAVYVHVDAQADLTLDGVMVEDTINVKSYGMIARHVLTTPIVKAEEVEREITFELGLGF